MDFFSDTRMANAEGLYESIEPDQNGTAPQFARYARLPRP